MGLCWASGSWSCAEPVVTGAEPVVARAVLTKPVVEGGALRCKNLVESWPFSGISELSRQVA